MLESLWRTGAGLLTLVDALEGVLFEDSDNSKDKILLALKGLSNHFLKSHLILACVRRICSLKRN